VFLTTDENGNPILNAMNTTTNTLETIPFSSTVTTEILASEIVPNYGSENTQITVKGQNFLNADGTPKIKKVMIGTNEAINMNIISSTLIYCDIPYGYSKVSIKLIDMSDVVITTPLYFTYRQPRIIDSYPKQGLEGEPMYIYGEYMTLVSQVLIGTVNANFTLLRRDYIRVTIPPGSGSLQTITLIDNLNNPITNAAFNYTYYVFNTTICFPAGTLVNTDQGIFPIQTLLPKIHTIENKPILAVTETYNMDPDLVSIEKDALGENAPNNTTIISPRHKIYYNGEMKAAYRLVGQKGVTFIAYQGEKLYNVLLKEYSTMEIQGLICETLHPDNPVAKYFLEHIKK
jgi:hypothetical protein